MEQALARAGRDADRLPLRRLDRDETAALIARVAPQLGAEAETAVFEATQGNPLFVDQTLRLLSAQPAGAGGALPLVRRARGAAPPPARAADPVRAALAVASVVGEQFSLAVLAEAAASGPTG